MGETKIEWAKFTWNPWIGCQKVGPPCDHCYAESMMDHRYGRVHWGPGEDRKRTSAANWALPLRWNKAAELAGEIDTVFCLSLGDIWDNAVDPLWRNQAFEVMIRTPNLLYLLLSKRIGNAVKMCDPMAGNRMLPRNCALGATMASQPEWDRDMPKLREAGEALGARFTFASVEPMLGPIDTRGDLPDWVIVGGESGPHARPMHPDWARSLRDQCAAAGVPYLFKQWGEWLPGQNEVYKPDWPCPPSSGGAPRTIAHWQDGGWGPRDTRAPASNYVMWDEAGAIHRGDRRFADGYFRVAAWASRVGKARAGRLLDGVEHNAMPPPAAHALVKDGETR